MNHWSDDINNDRLFDSLKILGITTEPTEVAGKLAWYTRSGEYLGTHGVEDGLIYLKQLMRLLERS